MRIVVMMAMTTTLLLSGCQNLPSYSWPNSQTMTYPKTPPKIVAVTRIILALQKLQEIDGTIKARVLY